MTCRSSVDIRRPVMKHRFLSLLLLVGFAGALAAADVTITAANVVPSSAAQKTSGVAGATIAAGQLVYRDASDSNKFKLTDADSATAAARVVYGIAINSASAGQPLNVCTSDTALAIGTHSQAVGTIIIMSDTAGGLMPAADVETGDYVTVVAIAKSATTIAFGILESLAAVP